ncbi:hypothetical protein ACFVSS_05760 [Peribacillus butanolivorans]
MSGMLFYKELKNIKRIILISGIGISIMSIVSYIKENDFVILII